MLLNQLAPLDRPEHHASDRPQEIAPEINLRLATMLG